MILGGDVKLTIVPRNVGNTAPRCGPSPFLSRPAIEESAPAQTSMATNIVPRREECRDHQINRLVLAEDRADLRVLARPGWMAANPPAALANPRRGCHFGDRTIT